WLQTCVCDYNLLEPYVENVAECVKRFGGGSYGQTACLKVAYRSEPRPIRQAADRGDSASVRTDPAPPGHGCRGYRCLWRAHPSRADLRRPVRNSSERRCVLFHNRRQRLRAAALLSILRSLEAASVGLRYLGRVSLVASDGPGSLRHRSQS